MPAVSLRREFGARRRVDQFRDGARPTELHHGKRSRDVHVVDQTHVVERRRNPRVFPEVIDDVRRLGDQPLDVLRVAATVLDARDVVLRPSAEVVIEGDDAILGIGGEHFGHVRSDMPRPARNENGWHAQATTARPIDAYAKPSARIFSIE